MNKYLIIPQYNNIEDSLELAEKYDLGFEFNDFFSPKMLLDEKRLELRIAAYKNMKLPSILTSHGDFYDVNVFSEDEEIAQVSVNRLYQSMEIAKDLGAEKVVFHTNINPQIKVKYYIDNWFDKNIKVFTKLCADFPDMLIVMENMFDDRPDELKELAYRMKDVDNFGICLDYSHAYLSKVSPDVWVKELSPFIKHVHINDNYKDYDSHLPVGDGSIDWDEFNELRKTYFPDATILVEVSYFDAQKRSLDFLVKHGMMD